MVYNIKFSYMYIQKYNIPMSDISYNYFKLIKFDEMFLINKYNLDLSLMIYPLWNIYNTLYNTYDLRKHAKTEDILNNKYFLDYINTRKRDFFKNEYFLKDYLNIRDSIKRYIKDKEKELKFTKNKLNRNKNNYINFISKDKKFTPKQLELLNNYKQCPVLAFKNYSINEDFNKKFNSTIQLNDMDKNILKHNLHYIHLNQLKYDEIKNELKLLYTLYRLFLLDKTILNKKNISYEFHDKNEIEKLLLKII